MSDQRDNQTEAERIAELIRNGVLETNIGIDVQWAHIDDDGVVVIDDAKILYVSLDRVPSTGHIVSAEKVDD